MVITAGWGMAVFVGVFCTNKYSGAHLNPAVTVGMAAAGKLEGRMVLPYVGAQMAGAVVGAVLVWVFYREHYTASP
jgi:glycerol uptake facilitator protein